MARCTRCVAVLPFDAWWCPQCATRSADAPKGADRRRPAELPPEGELDPRWQAGYLERIRRRRRRHRIAGAGVLAGAGLLCGTLVAFSGGGGPRGRVKVPLLFGESVYGPSFNAPPGILVTIGDNQSIPVIVDTGSVGLRVFSDRIKATAADGVRVSAQPDRVTFADGSSWTGRVARATVRIGGLATTGPIPFQLVDKISCVRSRPGCASAPGIRQVEGELTYGYGVLGIGLGGPAAGDPAVNPLSALPPPYGRTWDVDLADYDGSDTDAGTLTLGPDPTPAPGTRTVIRLAPAGSAGGVTLWDDRPTLCWSFGTRRTCDPTLLDSGSGLMVVAPGDARVGSVAMGPGLPRILAGNVAVQVALPGRQPFWGFDTGGSPGTSAVAVVGGQQLVNSGVQVFFELDVRYDLDTGTITLRQPPARS